MSLLNTTHKNPWQAAVSIAANRASKVRLLRQQGESDLADTAQRALEADVVAFLDDNPPNGIESERLVTIVTDLRSPRVYVHMRHRDGRESPVAAYETWQDARNSAGPLDDIREVTLYRRNLTAK